MPLVFMYGPDTVQGRMFDRVGPSDVRGPALLPGFTLVFDKPNLKDKREGLPNLREAPSGEVFGVVFELKPKQLELLDGFFGGYEQRSVRAQVMVLGTTSSTGEHQEQPTLELTPVTATTWIARRTARNLKPSAATVEATAIGMEENGAPTRFLEALKEVEALPSDTIELMVQFERGFAENEARTLMEAAGGRIRRRMRTDHEDEVMLLVKLPRDRVDVVEADLAKHPKVTLVERNSSDYRAL